MNVRLCLQRLTAILLILIIGICGMPAVVLAAGHIDTDRESSLRVYFGEDGTGFPGTGKRTLGRANRKQLAATASR